MLYGKQFREAWDAAWHPLAFDPPRPLLPDRTTTFLFGGGLPKGFTVSTYTDNRFTFLTRAINLAAVWAEPTEVQEWSLPVGWARFWQIGEVDYGQAWAWLCIEEVTGRVVGIDVENDEPIYTNNSSIEGMMRCVVHLRDWARATGGDTARWNEYREAVASDPALPPGEAETFWTRMIDAAIETGTDRVGFEAE